MKPLAAPIFLAFLAAPALFGSPSAEDRIVAAARSESFAIEHAEILARRIGPRLTGSENLRRAAEWARDRLASYGIASARLEPVGTLPLAFERGPSSGRMVRPERSEIRFAADAWTRGTRGPLAGRAVLAPEDDAALEAFDAAGSWVLVRARSNDADFEKRRAARFAEKEIAGLVRRSPREEILVQGRPVASLDDLPPLPEVTLPASRFDALWRRAGSGEDVRLEFDLRHEST
jgi:hypothetical protein